MLPPNDPQQIRDLFASHGIRCTKQREEIYAALAASVSHPTPEEVFQTVRAAQPGMSLATVYNTLDLLTRRGLCRRMSSGRVGGPCRYDADLSHHLHLAMADGEIRDVPDELGREVLKAIPAELLQQIEAAMGVRLGPINIELVAIETEECSACSDYVI